MKDLLDFVLNSFVSKKYDPSVLYNLFILSFWYMLRVGEAARLLFDHCVLYRDPVLDIEKLRLTIVHPKTASALYPDQFVCLAAIPNNPLCPVAAFKRLQLKALEDQRFVFADIKGRALGTSNIGAALRAVLKQWKVVQKDVPEGKISFHVFRISSIGHHSINLGLSIFEVQSISRHKFGSQVTQEVYLAKSQEEIAMLTASKISKLADPTKQSPISENSKWMQFMSAPCKRIFQSWHRLNPFQN